MNETSKIVKPLTLVKEEFSQSLVELCNNSGLPFFIIESTLKDFIQEVHTASVRQLEIDRKTYNAALADKSQSKE